MDSSWTKNLAEVVKDGTAIALATITKGNGFVQRRFRKINNRGRFLQSD